MVKASGWPPRFLTKPKSKVTAGPEMIEFIEAYCRITKDTVSGKTGDLIVLRPWQQNLINSLFTLRKNGSYQHRTALIGLPRKSGKSSIGSSIALYELLLGQDGGEVYSCAGDKEQARIVFKAAKRMVELDSELSENIKVYRDALEVPATGSTYRVLSADASSQEGLSPTLTIFDELHVQPNSDLWETMTLGSGARTNSLTLAITTAGVKGDRLGNDTICYQLYQHGQRIVNGEELDPTFFFAWWEPKAGSDADYKDPKVWAEANPGYGDLQSIEDFESVVARTSEVGFRTKRLNQWVSAAETAFPQGAWDAIADPTREIVDHEEIILGFDGSYTMDSTALIGCCLSDKHIFVIEIWERPQDQPEWRVPVIEVEARIKQACRDYDVVEIACDPYRWQRTMAVLDEEEGLPVVSWPTASIARMGPAWQTFYDAVIDKTFTHSGDPRLARHVGNMVMKRDARGVRPTKEHQTSPRKIDAAIGAIIAFNRANAPENLTNIMESIF